MPLEWIAVVLAAALAAPVVGVWVLGHWRPSSLARLLGDADIALPGISPTVACVTLYGLGFVFAGFALNMLAQGPLAMPDSHFTLLTGVYVVAFVAG